MRRSWVIAALVLAGSGLSGCAAANSTAELAVTYQEGTDQVTREMSFDDLTCRASSINRSITSDSVNKAGEIEFLATAPKEDRNAYVVSIWFDGSWFGSSEEFDASGSTITFDGLPGFVSESPDGERPASAGVDATLNGTITCR